jgi:ketosteroid isomerase-like protein
MENWARVLLLIVLLPLGRLVHATEQEAANGVDRQAAVNTVLGVFRAAELKQVDRVEAYHWFGPEFTKFDELGLGREDAATARAAERRDLAMVKTFKAAVQDLKVDLIAGAAVATFVLAYSADTAEGAVEAKLRSTVVLAKRAGSWKIVHEHYSRLVPTP